MLVNTYSTIEDFEENYQLDLKKFLSFVKCEKDEGEKMFINLLIPSYEFYNSDLSKLTFEIIENKNNAKIPINFSIETLNRIFKSQFKAHVLNMVQKKKLSAISRNINLDDRIVSLQTVFKYLTNDQYQKIKSDFLNKGVMIFNTSYGSYATEFLDNYSEFDINKKNIIFNYTAYKNLCTKKVIVRQYILNKYFARDKPRAFNLDYKFAILDEMGFIKWCRDNNINNENTASLLVELLGGAKSTMLDKLKPGFKMNKETKEKAIHFINSKKYPI